MPSSRLAAAIVLVGIALVSLVGFGGAAQAQTAGACAQIRAEMASLGRARAPSGQVNRLRNELGRVQNALAANDCFRSRGFLGLGDLPPVCAPLRAQAGQLQAQLNAAEGGGGGNDARRAQLMSAWQRYGCDVPQRAEPRQQRGVLYATPNDRPGLLDRLFGSTTEVAVEPYPPRGVAPPGVEPFDSMLQGEDGEVDDTPRRRRGGALAVCVRTCDGFFFPVNFEGLRARDEYDEVCKSLCPAAQTRVYFMSHGGLIDDAATREGEPYTALPNAKKYQENRDLSCICKQPGQTWASAMNGVTDLVELRKGDIVVSPEQALQMSRPKEARPPQTSRQREAQKKIEARAALPETQENAPLQHSEPPAAGGSVRTIVPNPGATGLRSGSGEARRP